MTKTTGKNLVRRGTVGGKTAVVGSDSCLLLQH